MLFIFHERIIPDVIELNSIWSNLDPVGIDKN